MQAVFFTTEFNYIDWNIITVAEAAFPVQVCPSSHLLACNFLYVIFLLLLLTIFSLCQYIRLAYIQILVFERFPYVI